MRVGVVGCTCGEECGGAVGGGWVSLEREAAEAKAIGIRPIDVFLESLPPLQPPPLQWTQAALAAAASQDYRMTGS